ncbi:MAG: lysophospholipid acyltransferase family protein [Patescibacteria group bacterium]
MVDTIARILSYPFLRWRVASAEGLENIPRKGPVLLVANHIGIHDPLLLIFTIAWGTQGRAAHAIAKWKIFQTAFAQRFMHTIPLYEDRARSMQYSADLLARGEVVLIYPEGRVNTSDTIGKVKSGAARLALQCGVPVIPIGIRRTSPPPQTSADHRKDLLFGRMSCTVGKPIDLSAWQGRTVDAALLAQVNRAIMTPVATLAGKIYMV